MGEQKSTPPVTNPGYVGPGDREILTAYGKGEGMTQDERKEAISNRMPPNFIAGGPGKIGEQVG